ncbi:putative transmembrane protein [Leptomonas pyrrhocoris]|uniref:Putative transmembrane protein n=1 Tax=Leptomonas pyrrhocoris TaxID=157538 RepID=A0A0M9G0M1_LEPPY|nr:putative transmembrane protein [Leptomonas pyrrhocoris]KPA79736.1 putative transmembrane protein [Leptomonas pyrrhocoris]|eukprot:XP_015658175.1 putative transmembrane protein [Leptomonas pyrrhocoris]
MLTPSTSPPLLPLQEDEVAYTRTPYQEAELRAASTMKEIREYITLVDKLTPGDSPARRLELNNNIRKLETELRSIMLEARRLAVMERRVESYGKLQQQCTTTQQLIRAHYGALVGLQSGATPFSLLDDDAEPTADDGGGRESSGAGGTHYDIAQDQEFQDFFIETRQNDAQIDAALDRIEFGVQRVNDNAQGIHNELHEQRSVLKETDKQVGRNEAQISGMNRRLLKTIKKLGKSRLITYVVLCVILIVLIIVIIFLGKSI